MKKITLLAALLGSAYFANAQVGIGTPTPHASAILDVTAPDKGVLIPRVALKDTKTQLLVAVTQAESLLVYNTATANDVTPGFYYWVAAKENPTVAAHWERVINQTQLNEVIESQADIAKIKDLLDAAYGSNNLGDTATDNPFGGMVFTPATGTYGQAGYVAPVIEYVKWNATTSSYDKVNVTSQLIDLIHGNETKTKVATVEGKQFYFAEDYVGTIPTTIPTPLPDGMYLIDVIGDVVNNIEEIFTTDTTIVINEGGTNQQTFTTVQEYIEYISQNVTKDGEIRIVMDTTVTPNQASFEQWNATTETWDTVATTAFSAIVKANETQTTIGKSIDNSAYTQVTVNPAAVDKIVYEYLAENATNYMDLTSDVEWSIENNTDVQNAIEEIVNNLLSRGGNVYFTRTDIAAGTPAGQLAIPAFSFYTIDATTGVKELVDIAQTIVNAITNANATQITSIKNALGDKIINNSSIITGDTYNSKAVRKGLFTTTITANTATTLGITLDEPASEIISITVKYGAGLTASVTDLVIDGTRKKVSFNIGTGNMYQVLGTSDINADVIIEFVEF